MDETRLHRKKRWGLTVYREARTVSGMSQKVLAEKLGCSNNTIQSWERGDTAPTFARSNELFGCMGVNPLPMYTRYLYPGEIGWMGAGIGTETIRKAILQFLAITTEQEILLLHEMVTGGQWEQLRNTCIMDAKLPMDLRVTSTEAICGFYEAFGPKDGLPDIDRVRRALALGENAVKAGIGGYTAAAGEVYADRLNRAVAKLILDTRQDAGISQEELADELHIGKKTLHMWETNQTQPDIWEVTEIFRYCGQDAFRPLYGILYPAACNVGAPLMSRKRAELIEHFRRASREDVRQTAFGILAPHGGSWHNMLHKYAAYQLLPPLIRETVGKQIFKMYQLASVQGRLVCTEAGFPAPDLELLEAYWK